MEFEIVEIEDMFQKKSYVIRDAESCWFILQCCLKENAERIVQILEEDRKVFGIFD